MAKYNAGDKIIISIRGIERNHPGDIVSYEIDPLDDGTRRFISEAVLDKIIDMGGDLYACKARRMQIHDTLDACESNRDRIYKSIKPIFEGSEYDLHIPESGKYKDKIINLINKNTDRWDYQFWCHVRNDRVDIVIKDSVEINRDFREFLKKKSGEVEKNKPTETSYRFLEEGSVSTICKYIVDHSVVLK